MSPRREDYVPPVTLPKLGSAQPLTRSRSFLSFDTDLNSASTASEYRLRFPNHHPKRPYVFHAQPSRVFDHAPTPVYVQVSPRVETSSTFLKNTEYQERFPNYRNYIPSQDLVPPHVSLKPNMPSATQLKKDRMSRSQYFHELITENEKFNGGQRAFGNSEQRAAFQWPYNVPQKPPVKSYSTMNMYETIPPIYREVYNSTN